MKMAVVHDYLAQDGGAEQVLRAFARLYPEADLFALFSNERKFGSALPARTSFLQRMPFIHRLFQWYLPVMPLATERHNLRGYDVILSNTSAFAKGVILHPPAVHVCYCHTPTRYLWSDMHSYIEELRVPRLVKMLLPSLLSPLRVWDREAASRVDVFVANSKTVAERIRQYYGRESVVVYPPVDTDKFAISHEPKTFFLAGGRFVSYKRFDLIIDVFNQTGLPLVVFGTGRDEKALRKRAKSNIRFVGRVSDEELARLYANARAYIHPQEEDFGITAVEAMASGTPVIAYDKGGARETIVHEKTGLLIDEQSWEAFADAVIRFDDKAFDPQTIRAHALQFDAKRFEREITSLLEASHKAYAHRR